MLDKIFNRTPKDLTGLAEKAEAEARRLDDEISQALLAGDDAKASELQVKHRDARDRAGRLQQAIKIANEEEQLQRDREEAERKRRGLAQAADACDRLIAAAEILDGQMIALDAAFEAYKLAELEALQTLRIAGHADNRLPITAKSALRWAIAHQACGFAEAVDVPRVPANRRKSFADSIEIMVPDLSASEDSA